MQSEADTPSNKILKTRSDNHLLGEGQGIERAAVVSSNAAVAPWHYDAVQLQLVLACKHALHSICST